MASKVLPILLLAVAASAAAAGPVNITGSRDITKILDQFPNFSTLSKLLTQTKVADQINSRQTITVLAVANSAISSVAALPADAQQQVLSLHVVLDYYDVNKISNLPDATALLPTLLQASGKAAARAGLLNATDVGDGQVKLGSAADGGSLTSDVIREIAMQPYNVSVIEVSRPIVPPGIASGGGGGGGGSAAPSPAPKADKAAPKASTSPSPSASSPSQKSNSSDGSPAPAADHAPVTSPAPSSTAPSADAQAGSADGPAGSADAPAGAADEKKASSASRRLVVGAGIGAAMGAAFLVAP